MERNNFFVIEALIKAGADVNVQGSEGRSPLLMAIEYCSLEVVKVLIEHGADIYTCDKWGNTPVVSARWHKKHDIEQLLIDADLICSVKERRFGALPMLFGVLPGTGLVPTREATEKALIVAGQQDPQDMRFINFLMSKRFV